MFENDTASTGLITAGELRKRLKGVPAEAVVCACVDGFSYAPLTDAKFDAPTKAGKDEGEIGCFLVMPDPSSELIQSLPGSSWTRTEPKQGPGVKVDVPVAFRGVVSVIVPHDVPTGQRRPLAEKFALARILATTENPDAPDDDACADFANDFKLDEDEASETWDKVYDNGVGGAWELNQGS